MLFLVLNFHLLDIEDSVGWVHGRLVLCGLADQSFLIGERNERRGGETTLFVGNWTPLDLAHVQFFVRLTDFNIAALVVGDTRIGRALTSILVHGCRRDGQRGSIPRSMPMAPSYTSSDIS